MVFLSHSLSFFRDFHVTLKVCLRESTGYSLLAETAKLIWKPVYEGFQYFIKLIQAWETRAEGGENKPILRNFKCSVVVCCCCFVFYARVSGCVWCIGYKNEVIHFPRDEFQNKSWGQMNLQLVFYFLLLHGRGVSVHIVHWKGLYTELGEGFWRLQLTDNGKGLLPI